MKFKILGDASVSSKVLVRNHQLPISNGTNFAHPDMQYPSYLFMKASQKLRFNSSGVLLGIHW
jgi:hypothetical protein